MVALWSEFILLLTMFYQCTLRASLMKVTYEKPVLYHEDVVDWGQSVYMVEIGYYVVFG